MAAISLDLRQRILKALRSEPSSLKVAERFEVSGSFVRKLRLKARAGADITPRRGLGKRRLVRDKTERTLEGLIEQHPDATLVELAAELASATGVCVSETTMWRTLRRMGITLKKRPFARRSGTAQT